MTKACISESTPTTLTPQYYFHPLAGIPRSFKLKFLLYTQISSATKTNQPGGVQYLLRFQLDRARRFSVKAWHIVSITTKALGVWQDLNLEAHIYLHQCLRPTLEDGQKKRINFNCVWFDLHKGFVIGVWTLFESYFDDRKRNLPHHYCITKRKVRPSAQEVGKEN